MLASAPLARCPAAAAQPGRPGDRSCYVHHRHRPSSAVACAASAATRRPRATASPSSRLLGRRRSRPTTPTTAPVVVVAAASSAADMTAPPDNAADPALVAKVRGWIASADSYSSSPAAAAAAFPATVDAEEARVLFADGGWALLDVRSALEADGEGRPLPRQPRSLAVPLSEWTSKYDPAAGKKVVVKPEADPEAFEARVSKAVAGASPSPAGLVVLCSGVPDPAAGGLRAELAAEALRSAGVDLPVAVLEGGYAAWALKWTNKLERRVVGFVIASGGTSIEQRDGGVGSKGSGVSGKGVEDLMAEALLNYAPGGMYA